MTQEEKELLLKDLCARLPYGVFIKDGNRSTPIKCDLDCHPNLDDLENIKPYLRPMSSMTEEEKKEYENCYQSDDTTTATLLVDFYNKKMFDYRGLIERGLGIDCTGLNIYKNEKFS